MSIERYGLEMLSKSGAIANQLPYWDEATQEWKPGSRGVPPGGTANQVLTKVSATDWDVTWSTPASGGASGGSGSVKDRRWTVGSTETSIDEFNDGSLDAAWTRVDGTGAAVGNIDWTEGADVLSSIRKAANTGNAINGIVRAIGSAPSTGDAWLTCLTVLGPPATNYLVNGIIISDGTTHGAGKQISAEVLSDNSGVRQSTYAIPWTNWGTPGTQSSSRVNPPPGTPLFLRLVYKGSSQWRADTSPDGISWVLGASLATLASFTPSHVGLYSRDGASGTIAVASYEFLRRVSGVT